MLKFLEPRKSLRLAPHTEIHLYIELVVSVQLTLASCLAGVLDISPDLTVPQLKSYAHTLAQESLNNSRADSNTVVLVCIESLIDGSAHLRAMNSDSVQIRLRDALESAEYCFGLLTSDLGVSEELVCAYFDGLARVTVARELSTQDRREIADEAQAAFVSTVCEIVQESLRTT